MKDPGGIKGENSSSHSKEGIVYSSSVTSAVSRKSLSNLSSHDVPHVELHDNDDMKHNPAEQSGLQELSNSFGNQDAFNGFHGSGSVHSSPKQDRRTNGRISEMKMHKTRLARPASIISVDYPLVPPGYQTASSTENLNVNGSVSHSRSDSFMSTHNDTNFASVSEDAPHGNYAPDLTSNAAALNEPHLMGFDEFILSFLPVWAGSLIAKPLKRLTDLVNNTFSPESLKIMVLCCFWYASSAMTNNIAKEIFEQYSFPVTLTYVQFGFVAVFCFFFGFWSDVNYGNYNNGGKWIINMWDNAILQLQRASKHTSTLSGKFKYSIIMGLTALFYIIVALTRIIQQSILLVRYWLALGLGIDEDAMGLVRSSKSNLIPPSQRLCGSRIRKPSREVFSMIFPLSAFLISGHVFSSIAISSVPVSFVHTIKALSPLFTVLAFKLFYKTSYSNEVWISLIPLTLGVMLACSFEIHYSVVGLVCSLASTLIFVGQNIFSKKLFGERRLDKLNMLLYASSCSFFLMTPIWFYSEGYKLFIIDSDVIEEDSRQAQVDALSHTISLFMQSHKNLPTWPVFGLFVLNGISHFCQNVFAFSILSLVSPVTYSIASLIKRIVVIVISLLYFGQHVGITQGFGIFLTFLGLWMYHRAKLYGGSEFEMRSRSTVLPFNHAKKSPVDDSHAPSVIKIQDEIVTLDNSVIGQVRRINA